MRSMAGGVTLDPEIPRRRKSQSRDEIEQSSGEDTESPDNRASEDEPESES